MANNKSPDTYTTPIDWLLEIPPAKMAVLCVSTIVAVASGAAFLAGAKPEAALAVGGGALALAVIGWAKSV